MVCISKPSFAFWEDEMKQVLETLKIPENRFWGTLLLLGGYAAPAVLLILWWKILEREEKVRLLSVLLAWALYALAAFIPGIGWAAMIAMLVFIILGVVRFYEGDIGYKIIGAYQLADAFIKK